MCGWMIFVESEKDERFEYLHYLGMNIYTVPKLVLIE